MRQRFRCALAPGFLLLMSGCAGLSQIQPIAKQFDEGARSLATTEENFFQAVKSADCNAQFYSAALDYSLGKGPPPGVSRSCTPTILSDQEITLRKNLLEAISLYADKIEALASGNNATLDTNAKSLAGELSKQLPAAGRSIGAGVEAAIIELANIVLDDRRFTDIKGAAAEAAKVLPDAIDRLKSENTNFSIGIDSKIGLVQVDLNAILLGEHGANAFFDAAKARDILKDINPFPAPAAQGAAQQSAASMANTLNDALDALVKANNALATADSGGIEAAMKNLVARAKEADSLYAALNK